MEKLKDGGPAFPLGDQRSQSGDITSYAEFGMTLRDFFAAKAMAALIAKYDGDDGSMDGIPSSAYQYADAMIRARES